MTRHHLEITARGPLARRHYHRLPINVPLPPALRRRRSEEAVTGELVRDARLSRVEAALFAADEPLTSRKLATAADLADAIEGRRLVEKLREYYDQDATAFQVEEIAGGWQVRTRPEFHPWLVRLRRTNPDPKLSPSALETLAIVAYRQPIMRADIEAIRGVQCGEIMRQLMEKGLVRIAGRDDSLGRPMLYGTTKKFLQMFGLNSLKDLPEVEHLRLPE
jgi:segregation and condensation protein B